MSALPFWSFLPLPLPSYYFAFHHHHLCPSSLWLSSPGCLGSQVPLHCSGLWHKTSPSSVSQSLSRINETWEGLKTIEVGPAWVSVRCMVAPWLNDNKDAWLLQGHGIIIHKWSSLLIFFLMDSFSFLFTLLKLRKYNKLHIQISKIWVILCQNAFSTIIITTIVNVMLVNLCYL